MNGTLYYHATIANAYVYRDSEATLWQVPMQPVTGWANRKPYRGYEQSLREMPPAQQRVLARTAGIPEDA
jgi:hypothetical protein